MSLARPNLTHSLVAAVLATSLAGCLGGSGPGPQALDPTVVPPDTVSEYSEETCGIEGVVHDEEFIPVADAAVGLLGAAGVAAETWTDSDGLFAFDDVGVGNYQLIAEKVGYDDAPTILVNCTAATLIQETILVVANAEVAVPYPWTPTARRETMECGLGSMETYPNCSPGSYAVPVRFLDVPHGNITGFLVEIAWRSSSGPGIGAETLTARFYEPDATDWQYETTARVKRSEAVSAGGNANLYLTGTSPIKFRAWVNESDSTLYPGETPSVMQFNVGPGHESTAHCQAEPTMCRPVRAYKDLPFDVYLEVYYWGEPSLPLDKHSLLPQ